MPSLVKCFIASEFGSTALEYGLVAAGITVVAVTALNAVFTLFAGLFATVVADLTAAATDPSRGRKESGSRAVDRGRAMFRVQRIVSLFRYARSMDNSAARNVLLLIAAMALGVALGAATKFGFQHDLSLANNPSVEVQP